jgi:beta-glucosidase/6-phospho-beta-glucosidase/beta-galactosidase
MLGYVQQRYLKHTGLPLLITENGFSIKNEAKMTGSTTMRDISGSWRLLSRMTV